MNVDEQMGVEAVASRTREEIITEIRNLIEVVETVCVREGHYFLDEFESIRAKLRAHV